MGGNALTEVPATLGRLKMLQALVLCDNAIESLPSNIANLHQLKSLLLHKNRLKTLPPEIVTLKNLTEVSVSKITISIFKKILYEKLSMFLFYQFADFQADFDNL